MYLLPAIDILDGKAVRLAKGDYSRVTVYNADPVEQARIFEAAGAEWLHMVDLDGARTGNADNIGVVEQILAATNLKVEVGGGIRSLAVIERLLSAGAARLVLGTALVRDPEFARRAVEEHGDALACGIDAKSGEAALEGWLEGSGVAAEDLARAMSEMGYRHLVYTDIARDGMQTGIDEGAYVQMACAFGHPVIASGGVADEDDLRRLAKAEHENPGSIEGVIAGRAVYEGALDVERACELCRSL